MPSKFFQQIRTLLDIDSHGGTLIQKDDYTLIAYDILTVNASEIDALLQCVGGCSIEIRQSNCSVSGFLVVIHQHNHMPIWRSADFFFLIQCLVLLVVSYTYAQVATHK